MNKILLLIFIATQLFSDCKTDMIVASSSAESAVDYASERNHKYALIDTHLAIVFTKKALVSCKLEEVSSHKMEELSKNFASLLQTKAKIVQIITPEKAKQIIRSVWSEENQPVVEQQAEASHKIEVTLKYSRRGVKTYFEGTTNLPEHTRIGIELDDKGTDFNIYIKEDGSFVSAVGFSDLGKPFVGKHKVAIIVYSNQRAQPKDVQKKLEELGVKDEGEAKIIRHYSF